MFRFQPIRTRRFQVLAWTGIVGACVLAPAVARAHFILVTPASSMSQDSLGSPQKLGPCGDEGGGTPTGRVTEFRPGETITVTVDEKIYHPGHYRIALAVHDRSEIPKEPEVTPGTKACGTAAIESPPVFPVLADGVLVHTAPFGAPQSVQITLPTNVTCTKCTLQILEFMSDHGLNNPGGCYYHHCADIAIQGTPVSEDAGSPDPKDPADASTGGGQGQPSGNSSSSGCSVLPGTTPATTGFASLFALTFFLRRRRGRDTRR